VRYIQRHYAATQRLIANCARGAKKVGKISSASAWGKEETGNHVFQLPRLLYVTPFHGFHCRVLCEAWHVPFSTSSYQALRYSAGITRDTSRYLRISARADKTGSTLHRKLHHRTFLTSPPPALPSACPLHHPFYLPIAHIHTHTHALFPSMSVAA
jgi:hypothetical protein